MRTPPETDIRAGIYVRISKDDADEGLGVARQEKDCRQHAAHLGWLVVDVYRDNDVSAADRRKVRPEYRRMLADLKAGRINAVIVWDVDRLVRQPIELEEFVKLCDELGVRHLGTVGGDIDLGNGDGLLVARIKGAVAAEEISKIKKRICRQQLDNAEAGKPHGGMRPFGYEADGVTIREDEAERIREAAAAVLAGDGLTTICNRWARAGHYATKDGKYTNPTVLKRILKNPRYIGKRVYRGQVIGDGAWQPILDVDTFEQVTALLATRKIQALPTRKYLVTGFAYCAHCAKLLYGRPTTNRGKPALVCKGPSQGEWHTGCGRLYITMEHVDELVRTAVVTTLATPAFIASMTNATGNDTATALVAELRACQQKLDHIDGLLIDGAISRPNAAKAKATEDRRIEAIRRQLAASASRQTLLGLPDTEAELLTAWETGSLEDRRKLMAACIERIDIAPATVKGGRFSPDRVSIQFRG